jgi:hypothetical protein
MVERVCSRCQHGNPLENQFCGRCGNALVRMLPTSQAAQPTRALVPQGYQLPVTMKQVGQGLAIGLATLAAEAGMAWLRSRIDRVGSAPTTPTPTTTALVQPSQTPDTTTVVSQRVLEVWEHGELIRRVVERSAWRRQRE